MKSSEILCCFGIIIIFAIVAFFLFSGGSSPENETPINFVAEATVVANDVDIELSEISEAEKDKFVASSEDGSKYYGKWDRGHGENREYHIKFTVNPDDINWKVSPLDSDYKNYHKIVEAYEKLDDSEFNETLTTNFVKELMKNYTAFYDKYHQYDTDNLTMFSPILLNTSSGDNLTFHSFETYYSFKEGTKETYDVEIYNKTGNYAIELHIVVPLDSIESFDEYNPYGDSYDIVKTY